ncbi:MAG: tyrosine-type recombinase/integrase [Bacteroidales bacterium]|nr:tyrosine-type recombinase/integrase [Bacteroidales bacterium]
MKLIERYLEYVRNVKRYSERTFAIYRDVLKSYVTFISKDAKEADDSELLESLNRSEIRQYEVYLLDEKKCKASTVNQHLSVLSGFCQFLIKRGDIKANPVKLVARPKMDKRLPEFFRQDAMEGYFQQTQRYASEEYLGQFVELAESESKSSKEVYEQRLSRLIISLLYGLGLRRSELIGLRIGNVNFARKVVNVVGKGNKSRAIPMDDVLADEMLLYLKAVEALVEGDRTASEPLLITYSGRELYPVYVDRVVKKELGDSTAFAGRKSPHVLRHSIATGLLNEGAQLNSIKEMLGHSSLAATQVYTHNSIAKLKAVYKNAHPRAKSRED